MRTRNRFRSVLAMAAALLMLLPGLALADEVSVDIVAVEGSRSKTIDLAASNSTSVTFNMSRERDPGEPTTGQPDCNVSIANPGRFTVNTPAGVTANPSSIAFTSCGGGGNTAVVTFTATAVGSGLVSLTQTTTVAHIDDSPADFNLNVIDSTPAPSDSTAPSITITSPENYAIFKLNQVVNADYGCVDNESAVTKCDGPVASGTAIDTTSLGAKSFKVDAASSGGDSSLTHNYNVQAISSDFSAPVEKGPWVNKAKAGRNVPLKWRLTDANGNGYAGLTNSQVSVVLSGAACSNSAPTDEVEVYSTSTSGLQNLGDGYYQIDWKSPTTTGCRSVTVSIPGGGGPAAVFSFTK